MSNPVINFTVTINGNAVPVAIELNDAVQKVVSSVRNAETQLEKFGNKAFRLIKSKYSQRTCRSCL